MSPMKSIALTEDKIIAWIEIKADGGVVGAFLGKTLDNNRLPAKKVCNSRLEAHTWIEHEAAEFGCSIEWLSS